MHLRKTFPWIVALTFSVAAAFADTPAPFVSPIFGDHMVLQRGKPNQIWGWSKSGDLVHIEIAGNSTTATAGVDGRWQARFDVPEPPGPYTVKIDGPQSVELHDVLVGDVWLCGGQSNMELGLLRARNGDDEVRAADHPEIRLYMVHEHASYSPAAVPQGIWKVCTPKTVAEDGSGGFSAVGYFFGRQLHDALHVPIGLIEDCVGGTPAETWMSGDTLARLRLFSPQLAEMRRLQSLGGPEYGNYVMPWYDQYDIGLKENWQSADFDDSAWKAVHIPGGFAELGVPSTPAVGWFRRQITLADSLPAGAATIYLGSIEQMDTLYINGQWIGASAWVENPRVYKIPPGVLKAGRNNIALRVLKVKPNGGFLSAANVPRLQLGDKTSIPLAGDWKGAVSVDARPPHPLPLSFENWPTMPTVLYHGMIEPVAPLALSGAIWYQGEANAERAYQYRTLLPAMIDDWRKLFGQGDFPFYIVSLPAFEHRRSQPGDDSWAELREAQAMTARDVPNCGVAVTIDTGEADNIHPKDKRIVGERLARCALAQYYGEKIAFKGPTFAGADKLPGALRLRFDHADGGLVAKGGELKEFSVAGADHRWHWADAKLDGDTIIVSSPDVPGPIAARYAWQSNPAATMYNGAGLPMAPFRTDDWREMTQGRGN
jgi:sialate O-acetylesterase